MKSTSKRSKNSCKNDEKDRLSELPDEILVHILSFLPIVDAVRTLIIRRFGNLWTLIPSLEFDDKEFLKAGKWNSANSKDEEFRLVFANFIQNVLILHKGYSIHRFKLSFDVCHGDNKLFINEVTTWSSFAIDREVKDLDVVGVSNSILPRCVFSSQFLVKLKLFRFRVLEPCSVHMRSLKELSLSRVEMSNQVFNAIVQGTPSLKELSLFRVTGLDEVRFIAPNIQKLSLHYFNGLIQCPNLKNLVICTMSVIPDKIGDISSISEVNIRRYYLSNANAVLSKFCHAEVFKFLGRTIPFYRFNKEYFPQTRWKCLHLKSWPCNYGFLAIYKLLRSSPHLEELVVCMKSEKNLCVTIDDNILSLEQLSFVMERLKTVTMRGYRLPCHCLLGLAELLLKNSVILEKMVILPGNDVSAAGDEFDFLKKLVSFPRASTNARVIFGSEVY